MSFSLSQELIRKKKVLFLANVRFKDFLQINFTSVLKNQKHYYLSKNTLPPTLRRIQSHFSSSNLLSSNISRPQKFFIKSYLVYFHHRFVSKRLGFPVVTQIQDRKSSVNNLLISNNFFLALLQRDTRYQKLPHNIAATKTLRARKELGSKEMVLYCSLVPHSGLHHLLHIGERFHCLLCKASNGSAPLCEASDANHYVDKSESLLNLRKNSGKLYVSGLSEIWKTKKERRGRLRKHGRDMEKFAPLKKRIGFMSFFAYFSRLSSCFSSPQKKYLVRPIDIDIKKQKWKILNDIGAIENFWNECFDKSQLKAFVFWFLKNYGENKTVSLLEKLKDCGFKYATQAGVSISIDDMMIPSAKSVLISQAEKQVFKAILNYKRGKITGVERFQKLIDTWHRTSEILKQEVINNFEKTDTLNPLYMMAFSGARGNVSQVRQLVGMRGLMANPQGQIIDFPIRSNFREGLTLTEYIISSYGARKGIVDTALRTANAGYLTRRLVDVAQHVIIAQFDCGTERGIFVRELKESNKCLYSLQNRLLGRILAKDLFILQNDSNILLGQRNQEISAELSSKIALSFQRVFIRSPLTCQTKKLVCQLCYGWSLAQGNLVSIGEAIGIIAAQSIGEPGTQLTMRTFHTGGVFSGDLTDQIIAPFNGLIEYSGYIPGTLIRTPEGTLAFLTKSEGSFFLKQTGNQKMSLGKSPKLYKIPAYTVLFLRNKEKFFEKQVLAQISLFSKQKKQRDNEERSMKSELEGEVFHGHIDVLEQINDYQEKKSESWDWGYIWVLAAKIYKFPVQSYFFPKVGDFVTMHSELNRICWFLSESCLLHEKAVLTASLINKQSPYPFEQTLVTYPVSQRHKSFPSLLAQDVCSTMWGKQTKQSNKDAFSIQGEIKPTILNTTPLKTIRLPSSAIGKGGKRRNQREGKEKKFGHLNGHILLKKTLLDLVLQKICYQKMGYFLFFKNFDFTKFSLQKQVKLNFYSQKRCELVNQKIQPTFIEFCFSKISSLKKEKILRKLNIWQYNFFLITSRKNDLTQQNNLQSHHKKIIDWFFIKFLFLIRSFRVKSLSFTSGQDVFFTPLSIDSSTHPANFLKKNFRANLTNKKQSTSNWSAPSNFLMIYAPSKYQKIAPGLFRFFFISTGNSFSRSYPTSFPFRDLRQKTAMENKGKTFEGKNIYHVNSKNLSTLRRILYVSQPLFHLKTLDFVKKISLTSFSLKKLTEKKFNQFQSILGRFPPISQREGKGAKAVSLPSFLAYGVSLATQAKQPKGREGTKWERKERNGKGTFKSKKRQKLKLLNIFYNDLKDISSMPPIFLKTNRQGISGFLIKKNPLVSHAFLPFPVSRFSSLDTQGKQPEGREKEREEMGNEGKEKEKKITESKIKNFSSFVQVRRLKIWDKNISKEGEKINSFLNNFLPSKNVISRFLNDSSSARKWNARNKRKGLCGQISKNNQGDLTSAKYSSLLQSKILKYLKQKTRKQILNSMNKLFHFREYRELLTPQLRRESAKEFKPKNYFLYLKNHWNLCSFLSSIILTFKVSLKSESSFFQTLPKIFLNRKKTFLDHQKHELKMTIKKGWIYFPLSPIDACAYHKTWIPLGETILRDFLFDKHITYIEVLNTKLQEKTIQNSESQKFKHWVKRGISRYQPFSYTPSKAFNVFRAVGVSLATQAKQPFPRGVALQGREETKSRGKGNSKEKEPLDPTFSRVPLKSSTNSFLLLIRNVKQYYLPKIEQFKNQIYNYKTQNHLQQNLTFQNYQYLFLNKQQKNETFLTKFPNIDLKIQSLLNKTTDFEYVNQKHYKNFLCKIPITKLQPYAQKKKQQDQLVRNIDSNKGKNPNKIPYVSINLSQNFVQFSNLKTTRSVYFSIKSLNLWALEIRFFSSSQFSSLFKFPQFQLNSISHFDFSRNQVESKEIFYKIRIDFWSYLLLKNKHIIQRQPLLIDSQNSSQTESMIHPFISPTFSAFEMIKERSLETPKKRLAKKLDFITAFPYLLSFPLFSFSFVQMRNDLLNPRISGSYSSRQTNEISVLERQYFSPIFPSVKNQLFISKKNRISAHSFFATTSFLSPYKGEIIDSSIMSKSFSLSQTLSKVSENFKNKCQLILTSHDLISFSLAKSKKINTVWKFSNSSCFPFSVSRFPKGREGKGKRFPSSFVSNVSVYPFVRFPLTSWCFLFPFIFHHLIFDGYASAKESKKHKKWILGTTKEKKIRYFQMVLSRRIALRKQIYICQRDMGNKSSKKMSCIACFDDFDCVAKQSKPSKQAIKKSQTKVFPLQSAYVAGKQNKSFFYKNHQRKKFEQISKVSSENIVIQFKQKTYKVKNLHLSLHSKKKNSSRFLSLGKFMFYGDFCSIKDIEPLTFSRLSPIQNSKKKLAINQAGLLIHINRSKLTLRKGQPFFVSPKAILHQSNGEFVQKSESVVTLAYQRVKTGDIVQGIPKIEQIFEARTTKKGRLFRDSLPNMLENIFLRYKYRLTQEKAVRQSYYKIRQIIVDGVQRVYRSQGVSIADKHIEVIVKEMTSKVRIINRGVTAFFPGELVDLDFVEHLNLKFIKKIKYEPLVLGISKASLSADSFLSSASFQHTIRVLSQAAIYKKYDFLRGLKENVIVGNLIPAGTGFLTKLDDKIKRNLGSNYLSVS